MKAVLISIQPKWVEKIASGEKTIEVRKSAPKCEEPFKCYIYCTKPSKKYQTICGCMVINTDELYRLPNGKIKHDWSGELMCCNGEYTRDNFLNGKVIGEFVCDWITKITPHCDIEDFVNQYIHGYPAILDENDCLSFQEMKSYLGNKNGYDWHISDLKIYDKPKELSEFINPCSRVKCISGCKDMKIEHAECLNKNKRPITRPPQSYMFVEDLGETK